MLLWGVVMKPTLFLTNTSLNLDDVQILSPARRGNAVKMSGLYIDIINVFYSIYETKSPKYFDQKWLEVVLRNVMYIISHMYSETHVTLTNVICSVLSHEVCLFIVVILWYYVWYKSNSWSPNNNISSSIRYCWSKHPVLMYEPHWVILLQKFIWPQLGSPASFNIVNWIP